MTYDISVLLEEKDLDFIERWTGGRSKFDIATMADIMIHFFSENPKLYEEVIVKSWCEEEE